MKRLPGLILALAPFLLIALAYLVSATREIELPGIYMDAVNPDYLVARWLNPDAQWIPAWIAPGNDILGRYPLLVGLHHGSLQLWLGAPLFWLFGMNVVGVRLTHAMFALAVLAAWYGLQRTGGQTRFWAVAFGISLAIEPSFVYAFRTQSYITMAPVALLMFSVIALFRAHASTGKTRIRWLAGCGLLSGLACWGYFVYAFFVPGLVVAAWLLLNNAPGGVSRPTQIFALGTGMAIGVAPFAVGFWLLARQLGGFQEGIQYFLMIQPQLGIAEASLSLTERLAYAGNVLRIIIGNLWHHGMMFGSWEPTPGAAYKLILLIGLPPVLWLVAEWRRCATPLLRIVVGLQISFVLGAMLFGIRTNGHHYMPFIPLAYAGLAAGIGTFSGPLDRWRRAVNVAAVAIVIVLLAINIAGNAREIEALRRTGGVGHFSDAINQLGTDLFEGDHNRLVIMPDWGLYMPTALLTQASMEMRSHDDFEHARQRLCESKDVIVGLITGDRAERFRNWQSQLDWTTPQIRAYRQRDGIVIFEVAIFSGSDSPGRCPGTDTGTEPNPP